MERNVSRRRVLERFGMIALAATAAGVTAACGDDERAVASTTVARTPVQPDKLVDLNQLGEAGDALADLEVVKRGITAFATGDFGGVRSVFTQDTRWTVISPSGTTKEEYIGQDQVIGYLEAVYAAKPKSGTPALPVIESHLAIGPVLVVLYTVLDTMRLLTVHEVADGLIVRSVCDSARPAAITPRS